MSTTDLMTASLVIGIAIGSIGTGGLLMLLAAGSHAPEPEPEEAVEHLAVVLPMRHVRPVRPVALFDWSTEGA